jgi:glyoxylase-like metal-dependent hydrolase (beta-lactamase superfamily II)
VAGYERQDAKPVVRSTEVTRGLVLEKNLPADAARTDALHDVTYFSATEPTVVDLGGVTVRVVPRSGHTSSDVSLELDDRNVLFCGDLFWNAMFPNYVDAVPSQLSKSARALRRGTSVTYVPGHGALAKQAEFDRYLAMIEEIEAAAKRGHEKGQTAAELGANYALPPSLGDWVLFNKGFFERAFSAWYRELDKH